MSQARGLRQHRAGNRGMGMADANEIQALVMDLLGQLQATFTRIDPAALGMLD